MTPRVLGPSNAEMGDLLEALWLNDPRGAEIRCRELRLAYARTNETMRSGGGYIDEFARNAVVLRTITKSAAQRAAKGRH